MQPVHASLSTYQHAPHGDQQGNCDIDSRKEALLLGSKVQTDFSKAESGKGPLVKGNFEKIGQSTAEAEVMNKCLA